MTLRAPGLASAFVLAFLAGCSDPAGTNATPDAGTPTDDGGATTCENGLTACNGACVDLTSPDHCGACDVVCPAGPSGSGRSCVGGKCTTGCAKGTRLCGSKNACEKESAASCGAACQACPSPTNGYALCNAGACATECNPGFGACSTGCCATKITDVALGEGHACTLDFGQTGDSATFFGPQPNVTPAPFLVTLPAAIKIAASGDRSCAILATGEMKCWGYSGDGGLGDPNASNTATPVQAKGMTNVTAMGVGDFHTCAVQGGQVYCWGSSDDGELGLGGALKQKVTSPTLVSGITNATSVVAAYSHTCALLATGTVKCWGRKANLGSVVANDATTPIDVPSLSGIVSIAAARSRTCAITTTGSVKCWGFGYLGNAGGTSLGSTTPVDVVLPAPATSVQIGYDQTCAILQGGALWCWGENFYGQVGDGSTTTRVTPVSIGLASTRSAAMGTFSSCAVADDGTTKCWGTKGGVTRSSTNVLLPTVVVGLP
jgi:hypothetical protein